MFVKHGDCEVVSIFDNEEELSKEQKENIKKIQDEQNNEKNDKLLN